MLQCPRIGSVLELLITTCLIAILIYSQFKFMTTDFKPPVKVSQRQGRRAENGRWYSQKEPFVLHVYSAFYDNRTSLMSTNPQIAIVALFITGIDRCVLWFEDEPFGISVPATVKSLNENDKLVLCKISANISNGQIPTEVSLAWADRNAKNGFSRTPFRVPIEITRHRPKRGNLALCLQAVWGNKWQPRQIVEWLEMQRLLGVELVVAYNRSMLPDVGRVFAHYTRHDGDGNRFVELRQSHGSLAPFDRPQVHQVAAINDCMYRLMGSYRFFAIVDFDEVIVPRKNFTTIPQLLDFLSVGRTGIGSFLFRNTQYFVGPLSDDKPDDVFRLVPSTHRSSSFSVYLTRRRRAEVSPRFFVGKEILDADACIGMWVHHCLFYTRRFQELSKNGPPRLEVDAELAHKHHYRIICNFDFVPSVYRPGSCKQAMESAILDNVMEKYSSQLAIRLIKQYEILQL